MTKISRISSRCQFNKIVFSNLKLCGIYMIISPTKKRYIGRSIHIRKRWRGHFKSTKYGNATRLTRSLCKYGPENHKFKIVELCDEYLLNEKEIYYIKKYRTLNGKYALNSRAGGKFGKLCDESIAKMAEKLKGRVPWMKGKKHSKESKKLISEACKGNIPGNKGIKHSKKIRKKISERTKEAMANMSKEEKDEMKRKIGVNSRAMHERFKKEGKVHHWSLGVWNKGKKNCYSKETRLAMGSGWNTKEAKIKRDETFKIRKYFFNIFKKIKL